MGVVMNTTILKTSLQLEMVFPNLELEIKTGKVKKKKKAFCNY